VLGAIYPVRNNINPDPAVGSLSRIYGTNDITFVNRSKLLVEKTTKEYE
jgi:hypothetical protein